ncbi:MAG: hypothetical protein ACRECV_00465 [Xanthobacteraceae bacterium]
MISDLDLWRAADILIKRYGTDAPIIAAQRADEMLAAGDTEGQLVWKRILAAVNELQRTKLAANERCH